MKICQIVASAALGGLEKHVLELSSELARTESVTLIAPAPLRAYVAESVAFIPFDFRRSRFNLLLWWDLTKIIRAGGFDLVHAER